MAFFGASSRAAAADDEDETRAPYPLRASPSFLPSPPASVPCGSFSLPSASLSPPSSPSSQGGGTRLPPSSAIEASPCSPLPRDVNRLQARVQLQHARIALQEKRIRELERERGEQLLASQRARGDQSQEARRATQPGGRAGTRRDETGSGAWVRARDLSGRGGGGDAAQDREDALASENDRLQQRVEELERRHREHLSLLSQLRTCPVPLSASQPLHSLAFPRAVGASAPTEGVFAGGAGKDAAGARGGSVPRRRKTDEAATDALGGEREPQEEEVKAKDEGSWVRQLAELLERAAGEGGMPETVRDKLRQIQREATQRDAGDAAARKRIDPTLSPSPAASRRQLMRRNSGEEETGSSLRGAGTGASPAAELAKRRGALPRSADGDRAGVKPRPSEETDDEERAENDMERRLLRVFHLVFRDRRLNAGEGPVLSLSACKLISASLRRLVRASHALSRSQRAILAAAGCLVTSASPSLPSPSSPSLAPPLAASSHAAAPGPRGPEASNGLSAASLPSALSSSWAALRQLRKTAHDGACCFESEGQHAVGEKEASIAGAEGSTTDSSRACLASGVAAVGERRFAGGAAAEDAPLLAEAARAATFTARRLAQEEAARRAEFVAAFDVFWSLFWAELQQCPYTPARMCAFLDFLHELFSHLPSAFVFVFLGGALERASPDGNDSDACAGGVVGGRVVGAILRSAHSVLTQLDPGLPDCVEDAHDAGRRRVRAVLDAPVDVRLLPAELSSAATRVGFAAGRQAKAERRAPAESPRGFREEATASHRRRTSSLGAERSSGLVGRPSEDAGAGHGELGGGARSLYGLSGDEQLPRYPLPFFLRLASPRFSPASHSASCARAPSTPVEVPPLWAFCFLLHRLLRLLQTFSAALLQHQRRLLSSLRSLHHSALAASAFQPPLSSSLHLFGLSLQGGGPHVAETFSRAPFSAFLSSSSSVSSLGARSLIDADEARKDVFFARILREACQAHAKAQLERDLRQLERQAFLSLFLPLDAFPALHELLQLHVLTDPPSADAPLAPALLTAHPAARAFLARGCEGGAEPGKRRRNKGRESVGLRLSESRASGAAAGAGGREEEMEREDADGEVGRDAMHALLEACVLQYQHPPPPLFELRLAALGLVRQALVLSRYSFGTLLDGMRNRDRKPRGRQPFREHPRVGGYPAREREGSGDAAADARSDEPTLHAEFMPPSFSPQGRQAGATLGGESSPFGPGSGVCPPRQPPFPSSTASGGVSACARAASLPPLWRSFSSSSLPSGAFPPFTRATRPRVAGRDLLQAVSLFVSAEAFHWMRQASLWLHGLPALEASAALRVLLSPHRPIKQISHGSTREAESAASDAGLHEGGGDMRAAEKTVDARQAAGDAHDEKENNQGGARAWRLFPTAFAASCVSPPEACPLSWLAGEREMLSEVAALRLREEALTLFEVLLTLPENEEIFLGRLDVWPGSSSHTSTLLQRILLLAWSLVLSLSSPCTSSSRGAVLEATVPCTVPLYDPVGLQCLLAQGPLSAAALDPPLATRPTAQEGDAFQLLLQGLMYQQTSSSLPQSRGEASFSVGDSASPSLSPRLAFARRHRSALQRAWGVAPGASSPGPGGVHRARISSSAWKDGVVSQPCCLRSAASGRRGQCWVSFLQGGSRKGEVTTDILQHAQSLDSECPATLAICFTHLYVLSASLPPVTARSSSSRRELLLASLRATLAILTHNVRLDAEDGAPEAGDERNEEENGSEKKLQRREAELQGPLIERGNRATRMRTPDRAENFLLPETLGRTWPLLRALCGSLQAQGCAAGGSTLARFQFFASLIQAALP
ncbi:hypothetical protein BESB_068670 [Besnoitia besnoiti]|uniref:Uncharacterized protein n=1 Tax=Besnoitia besnoiti TaxID=94643 RepID=A0A2A9MC87_BESBE|nr:hypothetical protein BESB_068670 [Besnoitia besnoiti]PFH34834.1 hypothetical protein BESB_068670 [Besnoitia besnoiti]